MFVGLPWAAHRAKPGRGQYRIGTDRGSLRSGGSGGCIGAAAVPKRFRERYVSVLERFSRA
eukprot:1356959-Pyramimonas_sp.AAC.1